MASKFGNGVAGTAILGEPEENVSSELSTGVWYHSFCLLLLHSDSRIFQYLEEDTVFILKPGTIMQKSFTNNKNLL